jgi:hypothetical protein
MPEIFTIIVVVVAVLGVAVSLTRLAWPFHVVQQIGRTGSWFHHQDEDGLDQLPDPNLNDAAIPRRPLRGRP